MKKLLFLLIISSLLMSCSSIKNRVKNKTKIKDTNGFDVLINQFSYNIENLWGPNESAITRPKDHITYSDQYKTRSDLNMDTGTITIETIADDNPREHLRQSLIHTMLMDMDPSIIDLDLDTGNVQVNKKIFLHENQILDDKGEPIRWKWHASHFADYLLNTCLQKRTNGSRKIFFITIQLVPKHMEKRAYKYLSIIRRASKHYGVDQSLILAIIQTESNFNPYAVSHADALGLMQVVRKTAGRDVFKMKGKWGQPNRRDLLDPENNIDIGTAYLSMLQNSYLGGIANPVSRRYAVITAYNGGAGSVLRIFAREQNQAFHIINAMRPNEVYKILSTQHPSIEARHYLYKVTHFQKNTDINGIDKP
ncbi:membrane-bound lytic murein transglycosylase MltC [Candidatus Steffania adelgidicola]|uniref:membrane-bound lytic murein transglycosylase MltC n=1 Tax=Candidatus Steffania adelgidicola TaxID=1076626 RepID=UPI001D01FB6D|nr:membrane-bound lytic murein transglycosylase MltC [Candidatus Steffania adelgidicola]UDG79593.1 Membrane-bound lytic murein transglycosylase C [Candidatus Steffania adelgidicola]